MKRLVLAIAVLLPALLRTASATGLRCNHDLVEVGDTAAQLLATCGEPIERRPLARLNSAPQGGGGAEQWTYTFGPANFLQIVTIEHGRVSIIEDVEQQ